MDKITQATQLLEQIRDSHPMEFFDRFDSYNSGMNVILMYLVTSNEEVYATTFSEKMNISRARVSKILQKLLDKQYITKQLSTEDARKEYISITDQGRMAIEEVKKKIISNGITLIDHLGIEKLQTFISISKEIRDLIK